MNGQPRTLGGRYELGEVIGRGGMATVRRAIDTRLGRPVAVKELRIDLASDHTFQARFRREAQAAAGLNHPNIVAVYDTGEELDPTTGTLVPYIVMELVEGRTLRDLLRQGRPILPQRALEFAQGVLDALAYSHKSGIVHRDIKPANVMLTESGMVKVMDFGIARAVADTSATMTQTAAVIGTAQYLSPEQARGETVDARSDIYSAGCLLYELLVGRPPFTGDSPVSVAYQHVREDPVPPSQLDPEITPNMDAVVLKALAKDPDHRYQNASAMRADVARLVNGQAPEAEVVPPDAGAATQVLQPRPPVAPRPAPVPVPPAHPVTEVTYGTTDFDGTEPRRALPEEPPPRRRGLVVGIITALVVAIIGLTALFFALANNPANQQVAVPNVFNEVESVAIEKIRQSQLVPDVKHVNGAADDTVGRVTVQNPARDVLVPRDSTVSITVNVGPETVVIPEGLEGKTLEEVKGILSGLKLSARPVEAADEPEDAKPDTVLKIDPPGGTKVPLGQEVTVTYASGKARVPELRNLTKEAAIAEAAKYGFKEDVLEWETVESTTATPGTVIATRPATGTRVSKTDKLVVILAVEPPPPTESPTPTPDETPSPSPTPDESDEPRPEPSG